MSQEHFAVTVVKTEWGQGRAPLITEGIRGLLPWLEHYGSCNQDLAEPSNKRVKLENHDKDGADEKALARTIPVAEVVVDLEAPRVGGNDERPTTQDLIRVSDIDVKMMSFKGGSTNYFSVGFVPERPGALAPSQIKLHIAVRSGSEEYDHFRRLWQLQNRLNNKKQGAATSHLSILAEYDRNDVIIRARLISTLLWQDGAAASFTAKAGIDAEIMSRYLRVPLLASSPGHLSGQSPCVPQNFYDAVQGVAVENSIASDAERAVLTTALYPFQQRAVDWMLSRESSGESDSYETNVALPTRSFKALDGDIYQISDLEGTLTSASIAERGRTLRGGVLSEEMGLGKTVELLSLIATNSYAKAAESTRVNGRSSPSITKATLIVTPTTILQQWKDEIARHAPQLKWKHYMGLPNSSNIHMTEEKFLADFRECDIVLTTYNTLAQEVHFAVDPPERALRNAANRRPRKRSPLVQLTWWRVCLDEAQMVESGVSNAATTASLLPRVNAWAVSGTPVKKDIQDLRGLLIFLGVEPFASSPDVWKRLIMHYGTHFHEHFTSLFGRIALRHTKDNIRDELKLPPQRRTTVTIPFTTIEEQNYLNLFEQMAYECGLTTDGSPMTGDWDPNSPRTIESMREWLIRLRQTCLHPQVGTRNKRALGRSNGPLRTVDEVLEVMIEQNEVLIRSEARGVVTSLCQKGHVYANDGNDSNRAEKALPLYLASIEKVAKMVEDARAELKRAGGNTIDDDSADEDDSDEVSAEKKKRGRLRNHLRNMLELQHACEFFVGSAYFQIKSNADKVEEDGDEFKALEEKEVMHYDQAKHLRREVLRNITHQAERTMTDAEMNLRKSIESKTPSTVDLDIHTGIESRRLLDKADQLSSVLASQTEMLIKWRRRLTELTVSPLVDKNDTDITGEEYEDSTKVQDETYMYFDAYRALVADRSSCITGQINTLVDHEMNFTLRQLRLQDIEDKNEGLEPPESRQKTRELLLERARIKQKDDGLLSLRGLMHEARSTEGTLQWTSGDALAGRNKREVQLVRQLIDHLQRMVKSYDEVQNQLVKDQEIFKTSMNQRLEFYRQLQQLSDAVKPYKEELDEILDSDALDRFSTEHERHESTLSTLQSKRRFLLHLRNESNSDAERICVICQSPFAQGVLTVCGHQFCKDCIGYWWRQHQTCPVCKRRLRSTDFHNITYKPKEMQVQEETHESHSLGSSESNSLESSSSASPAAENSAVKIYSSISASDLSAIQSIDLPSSRSFGTKIDTIARHLLHIRVTDPGSKTIIFSQYRDFLNVLSSALKTFSISNIAFSAPHSVVKFHEDPSIEAFLLDAKSDSSGLNLVNATNVMLCEPLVNPGIELQAIARVHRIGQTRETRVFMYLVKDTVEEGVYEVSVRRRQELMQKSARGASRSRSASMAPASTDAMNVDRAERLEMQAGGLEKLVAKGKMGGENVRAEDLWKCLFGATLRSNANSRSYLKGNSGGHAGRSVGAFLSADVGEHSAAQEEIARHVRAEAAESRSRRLGN